MGYRGEDLDLRTPQMGSRAQIELGAGEAGGGRTRSGYGMRGEPIWVDDTVLACCNLAFDLAATHRAGEVRLEHLVYAMTRIDAAAEALEGRGVRVAALRREMGSVVASEIPIGLPNGKGTPRRSEEFESVLREAAELAHRRNAPAAIDDLVAVMIDTTRDLPGLLHVRRHLGSRIGVDRPDYEPIARGREPAIRPYSAPVYEPRPAWSDPVAAMASRTDVVQNSRIEALEQAVRALGSDLASERKAISNLLLDIQRDVGSRRDDDLRIGGGLVDRLAGIEHAIEKRLAALERVIQSTTGEGSRHWAVLGDRLKNLESTLLARPGTSAGIELARLVERFETIEQVVVDRASEASAEANRVAEQLKMIEDGQAAQKVQALQLNSGLAAEVNKLATTLSQHGGGDRSLALVNERFQALGAMIERQRGELAGSLAQPMSERLNAIGTALESRQVEGTRVISTLAERVAAIERSMTGYVQKISEQAAGYDEDLGEVQDALLKVANHQAGLSGAVEQWRQQSNEIGVIGNRLAAIERLTMRPAQIIEQLAEKVDAIHRITAEKVEKRNAFYYWLFGTNSWLSASWPKRRRVAAVQQAQRQPPPAAPR